MDAVPLFIGITGKRAFADDAATRRVRNRLAGAFDRIEDAAPALPKILLTGAATGTDLIAAEEILRPQGGLPRRNWQIICVLPFDRKLFEEDFRTPEEMAAFQLVIDDQRVKSWPLPLLEGATPSDVSRHGRPTPVQADLRRRHYEQVGLWIAETANILIAVMPTSEEPDKIGGTARIVRVRRSGRPDSIATQVMEASTVLAPPPPELLRPPARYTWLIDPAREPPAETYPVKVLPPLLSDADGEERLTDKDHLLRSETIRYVAQRCGVDATNDQKPPPTDPAAFLRNIYDKLRQPGQSAATTSRATFYILAALFLAAVLAFEVFAKFLPTTPWMPLIYVLLLGAAISLYYRAHVGEWQAIAEDRRVIREALRVQRAWWQAGLRDRVDHVHLLGADPDLSRVREAIRNIVLWTLFDCNWRTPSVNWSGVIDRAKWRPFKVEMPGREMPSDWIGNQKYYFNQRKLQREAKSQLIDSLSWTLFVASGWLAVILCAALAFDIPELVDRKLLLWIEHANPALPGWIVVAGIVVMILCLAARGHRRDTQRIRTRTLMTLGLSLPLAAALWLVTLGMTAIAHDPARLADLAVFTACSAGFAWYWRAEVLFKDAALLWPSAIGLGALVLAALSILSLAAYFAGDRVHHPSYYMVIVSIVFLPAVAGAIRFIGEKLAIEAEALSYRDAYVWFEDAALRLEAAPPGRGNALDDDRARDLVRKLGILALGENENWLRSRRERPLSPLIGG